MAADPALARNVLLGAAVGALVGLLVGLIVRGMVGSGSLAVYEVVAGGAGLVLGALLGAFYGGALSVNRRR